MTLADDLKPLLWTVRAIPGQLGLRPYAVKIVQSTWSGIYPGRGEKTSSEISITESGGTNPKVRFLDEEKRALANLNHGAADIGPITPDSGASGTALSSLLPALADGAALHVKLIGPAYPDGALFAIKEAKTDRAMRWMLRVEPVEQLLAPVVPEEP